MFLITLNEHWWVWLLPTCSGHLGLTELFQPEAGHTLNEVLDMAALDLALPMLTESQRSLPHVPSPKHFI